ncbi:MAG TPA: DUF3293 domain-containing protein [Wenzhouxiangella sp.]
MPAVWDPDLDKAYRETEYWVATQPRTCVVIGVQNPAIAALHRHHGVGCSTIITAHNPRSLQQSADLNSKAQAALTDQLNGDGYPKVLATGKHPHGAWPPETGWLVLGMDEAQAAVWARRFSQHAVVWIDAQGRPDLRWFA